VSIPFDGRAVRLVRRAYAVKGEWAGDYVAPPGPRARLWAWSQGISLMERDRWGELRYIRAYKRSVFWWLEHYGGVAGLRDEPNTGSFSGGWHAPVRGEWRTGIRVAEGRPHAGEWAVRFRIHPGGSKTSRIGLERAERLGENWIDRDGHPTFRQSTADERDY
jgi:hypothetical protein